jgi:hypothetical protein
VRRKNAAQRIPGGVDQAPAAWLHEWLRYDILRARAVRHAARIFLPL